MVRFWSVPQASTRGMRRSRICLTLCLSTNEKTVYCAGDMAYLSNRIHPVALLFPQSSTKPLTKTQLELQTLRLHDHHPREKIEKGRAHNKRRQQRLVRPVEKILISTALASIVGPVVGYNVIPASLALRKRTNQSSASAKDPEWLTGSFDKDCIPSVLRPQKRQRRATFARTIEPSVKPIRTTP